MFTHQLHATDACSNGSTSAPAVKMHSHKKTSRCSSCNTSASLDAVMYCRTPASIARDANAPELTCSGRQHSQQVSRVVRHACMHAEPPWVPAADQQLLLRKQRGRAAVAGAGAAHHVEWPVQALVNVVCINEAAKKVRGVRTGCAAAFPVHLLTDRLGRYHQYMPIQLQRGTRELLLSDPQAMQTR